MNIVRLDTLALSILRGYECRRGPGNKRALYRRINGRLTEVMPFEILEGNSEDTMDMQQDFSSSKKISRMRMYAALTLLRVARWFTDSAAYHNLEARRHHHKAMKRMDIAQKLQVKSRLLQG